MILGEKRRSFTEKLKRNFINKLALYLLSAVILSVGTVASAYFNLCFPVKYYDIIKTECSRYSINEQDVLAIIWAESKFDPSAKSNKGALGLMQLTPKTAEWCAKKISVPYLRDRLFEPDYNIKLGVYYYGYLLKKFGYKNKALAAYNAGEGKIASWNTENGFEIQYSETRRYIAVVNAATQIYTQKLSKIR